MATSYKGELAKINADQAARHAEVMAAIGVLVARSTPLPTSPPKEPDPPVVEHPPVTPLPPVPTPPSQPSTPGVDAWTRTRPFVMPAISRSGVEIIAARLVPPFDQSFVRGSQGGQTPNTPGNWPGTLFMGGTGEREEIGLVVLDDAIWLTSGGSPSDMIVWAETHGQMPVHFRVNDQGQADPIGTHMVDVFKLPNASCFPNADSNPYFPLPSSVDPDLAHYPSACYVPYLATGDLFYLQEVQDAATYALLEDPIGWGLEQSSLPLVQIRTQAWSLNLIVQAYLATLEAEKSGPLPSPLLPSAYWKRILDDNCARFNQQCVKSAHPLAKLGLLPWTEGYDYAFWQHDMLGAVMGWMIWTGQFPEWRENYEWVLKAPIARSSGKSGYPRTRAIQYAMKTDGVSDWAGVATRNSLTETVDGKLDVMDVSYGAYLRGNLALAKLNKITEADECFAWLDPQIKWIPAKWAIAA